MGIRKVSAYNPPFEMSMAAPGQQWLDAPSGATTAAAHSLLSSLGATGEGGNITAPGNRRSTLATSAAESSITLPWTAKAPRLQWLDAPSAATMAAAHSLLSSLGAISADGNITALGRRLGDMSVHPRLAVCSGRGTRWTCSMAAVADMRGHTSRGAQYDQSSGSALLITMEAVQLRLPHTVTGNGVSHHVIIWYDGTKAVKRIIKQRIGTLTLNNNWAPVCEDVAAKVVIAMLRDHEALQTYLPKVGMHGGGWVEEGSFCQLSQRSVTSTNAPFCVSNREGWLPPSDAPQSSFEVLKGLGLVTSFQKPGAAWSLKDLDTAAAESGPAPAHEQQSPWTTGPK
ncbi:hypothetical protein WJX73_009730 [Symbiochloris irregularis]|uniref:Helicase-associated domain-containing protein n=1 Tax=Symbiochloris irregularis TaxID=706552 RepID=A0AAW1NZ22_9CHLO